MTNVIKISVAKENTCKEIEVQNHYLKFSTIEELEEKLSGMPYGKKIESILRLKRFNVEDLTKTFVIDNEKEFEAVRYHIDCNLVIEEKKTFKRRKTKNQTEKRTAK